MGKNKALAHHTSTYFHTRRVSIRILIVKLYRHVVLRQFKRKKKKEEKKNLQDPLETCFIQVTEKNGLSNRLLL